MLHAVGGLFIIWFVSDEIDRPFLLFEIIRARRREGKARREVLYGIQCSKPTIPLSLACIFESSTGDARCNSEREARGMIDD